MGICRGLESFFDGGVVKSPTRVLLLGEHWDCLRPTFESLADRGDVQFVGPLVREIPDAVTETGAAAIMAVRGPGGVVPTIHRPAGDEPSFPPVLLCVDDDGLETEELFEFADDFLLIPCSAAELYKRLTRLVRCKQVESPGHILRHGKITLDTQVYEVALEGKRVNVAWMEFQLLRFLMEHPGRIFTRDELLSSVWSVDNLGGTRTVDVHIRRLRQKLGLYGNTNIRTVANVGYGLVEN